MANVHRMLMEDIENGKQPAKGIKPGGLSALGKLIVLEAALREWQLDGILGGDEVHYNNNDYYYNNHDDNHYNYNYYNYNYYYYNFHYNYYHYNYYQSFTRDVFYIVMNEHEEWFVPTNESIEITKRWIADAAPITVVMLDRAIERVGSANSAVHRAAQCTGQRKLRRGRHNEQP